MLTFYRILSYLLLPVALLLGLATLAGLVMALGNFSVLLSVFACGASTIYIIASFLFLQRVVEAKRVVRHSLRDWVRANGFVAMGFGALLIVQSYMFLTNPEFMKQVMEQVATMQQAAVPPAAVMQSMKAALVIMQVVGILMLVHIAMSFRLLRQYASHFD
jgi:hypothetical protein